MPTGLSPVTLHAQTMQCSGCLLLVTCDPSAVVEEHFKTTGLFTPTSHLHAFLPVTSQRFSNFSNNLTNLNLIINLTRVI
jgi:hypothetical protein